MGQVLALLPPHVHQHLAAQQEHLPDLPAEVGVRQCAEASSSDARRAERRRSRQLIGERRILGCCMRPGLGESVCYRFCVLPVWIFVSSVYVVRE